MDMLDLLFQDWQYRGEGNANVAISLPRSGQILRIPKINKPTNLMDQIIYWLKFFLKWDYKKQVSIEKRNLDFYNLIMIPLFGNFAKPAIFVNTYPGLVKKLGNIIEDFRSEHRKHQQLQLWTATLLPDYTILPKYLEDGCFGDTLSIEIKPKQGWIPLSEREHNKCQFCLHQYLKLQRGQVQELSLYCPLDLFSGDRKRIVKALKCLILTPQNNLRIFKNGYLCYGENVSKSKLHDVLCEFFGHTSTRTHILMDKFCILLAQAALKNFETDIGVFDAFMFFDPEPKMPTEKKCVYTQSKLPEGCILQRIFEVQKLNQFALNQYIELSKKMKNTNEWEYISSLLEQDITQLLKNYSITTPKELDLYLYLLAAVANDCSFMITLKKINGVEIVNKKNIISDGSSSYMVNIGVFDLYPKSAHTITKHLKRKLDTLTASSISSKS